LENHTNLEEVIQNLLSMKWNIGMLFDDVNKQK